MFDDELDRFKRDINLVEYAAHECGYERLRRESSRASHVLRHPQTGDKVVVAKNESDGHWVYFSVRNERDNGSIIDFVQARRGHNLGEVRKALREWARSPQSTMAFSGSTEPSVPRHDSLAVTLAYAAAHHAENSSYLNGRGLRRDTLRDRRFEGSWKEDQRANVLFVHRDEGGVTGFEVKNEGFSGFAPGGMRTLWQSNAFSGDRRLVVAESAIDAMSYHQLHRDEATRYASTAGSASPRTLVVLERAIERMSPGSTVVAATDADAAGRKLASQIAEIAARHAHVRFIEHRPEPAIGKDWNAVLQRVERDFVRSMGVTRGRGAPER